MGSEKQKIEELKKQGYKEVTVWDTVTDYGQRDHSHPFDTYIFILDGEIEISIGGKISILKSDDEARIPKDILHHAKLGPNGCRYITAEK